MRLQAQKDGARGTVYYPSGECYQGEWHNNLRHGEQVPAAAAGWAWRPAARTCALPGRPPAGAAAVLSNGRTAGAAGCSGS
jgi:hypothetical protein